VRHPSPARRQWQVTIIIVRRRRGLAGRLHLGLLSNVCFCVRARRERAAKRVISLGTTERTRAPSPQTLVAAERSLAQSNCNPLADEQQQNIDFHFWLRAGATFGRLASADRGRREDYVLLLAECVLSRVCMCMCVSRAAAASSIWALKIALNYLHMHTMKTPGREADSRQRDALRTDGWAPPPPQPPDNGSRSIGGRGRADLVSLIWLARAGADPFKSAALDLAASGVQRTREP
jgi:hypothetical protein